MLNSTLWLTGSKCRKARMKIIWSIFFDLPKILAAAFQTSWRWDEKDREMPEIQRAAVIKVEGYKDMDDFLQV